MYHRFIEQYEVILLDQGKTFMFNNDRFGPEEDYYRTYHSLGGKYLSEKELSKVVNTLVDHMYNKARDPDKYDSFPSIPDSLTEITISKDIPIDDIKRLDELIALHEVSQISNHHVRTIKKLSASHRLGIVSNIWGRKTHFESNLKEAGIYECFEHIVWSLDQGCIKPSPNIFNAAIRSFDVDLSKIAYVGDNPMRDIDAAKKLGLSTVWIKNDGAEFPDIYESPDLIIEDLGELVED